MSLPAIIFQRLRLRYAWALFAISRKACRIGINLDAMARRIEADIGARLEGLRHGRLLASAPLQ